MSNTWHWGVFIFFGLYAIEAINTLRRIDKKLARMIEINALQNARIEAIDTHVESINRHAWKDPVDVIG